MTGPVHVGDGLEGPGRPGSAATTTSRRRLLFGVGALAGLGAVGGLGAAPAAAPDTSPGPAPRPAPRPATGPTADAFDAEVAHYWAASYVALMVANGTPPPSAARLFTHLGLVLHAAAAACTPDALPFAGRVAGALGQWTPPVIDGDLNWPAVANEAFAHLLPRLYVDLSGPIMAEQLRVAEKFTQAVPPGLRARSTDAGRVLGQAVLDWERRVMQSDPAQNEPVPLDGAPGPGRWVPTPPEFEIEMLPHWGHVRTMVVGRGADVRPADPPPYSEDPAGRCHQKAVEVVDIVAARDPEQLAIARHWADGEWSMTPPGHWLGIATAELRARGVPFDTAAETYLRLACSQHDALVACWWAKYHHYTHRPVTYVRRVLGLSDWLPPVKTPPFPEYPSGHSVQSAAGAEVLAAALGTVPFVDRTTESSGLPPRSYPDFRAAAREASISRVYAGIHYRDAVERGAEQGRRLGRTVAGLAVRG